MKKQIYLIVFQLFLTGCATNYYVNEDNYPAPKNYEKISVYVTNPEHEAYEVLKKSEIYDLTDDISSANKLTIVNLFGRWKCGNPYLGTVFSGGLLPSGMPNTNNLVYSLESEGITKVYKHKLEYWDRYSIWENALKPFAYSKQGAQAKALSLSTRDICSDFEKCQSDY
jgi:hypothetical protein